MTKSNDRMSDAFNRQASRPCNKSDTHLLGTSCNVTSSDDVLPTFSKIALAARQKDFLETSSQHLDNLGLYNKNPKISEFIHPWNYMA